VTRAHRCAKLIEVLGGAKPSPGLVHSVTARAAAVVAEANKAVRCLVILAHRRGQVDRNSARRRV
jgi:hypothetical protein